MKKVIFYLFTAIYLCSCAPNEFTMVGSVENKELNGKTIFIKERIDREWIVLDSTVIENGKFSFKGIADTAKIAYLAYAYPDDNNVRQAFVLENGKISAAIDSVGFMVIKGTTQNDLLQTYMNAKNVFYIKADAFSKTNDDTIKIKTKEQELAFAKEEEKLNQEEVSIDKKFSTEHVNTLVGTYVFMNSFFGMTILEKEAVVKLMNNETKNIKRIQEIIADIETEKKVAVGNQFVDFKLPALPGDSIALSDLVGKTDFVLVDFWASWCGPCIRFLPELKRFYAQYKGPKLEILGVSLDDNKEAWTGAIASHQIPWKQASDLKGWKCDGSRIYAVNSIPNTVLIDKNGKIVGRNLSIPEIVKLVMKKVDKK